MCLSYLYLLLFTEGAATVISLKNPKLISKIIQDINKANLGSDFEYLKRVKKDDNGTLILVGDIGCMEGFEATWTDEVDILEMEVPWPAPLTDLQMDEWYLLVFMLMVGQKYGRLKLGRVVSIFGGMC